MTVKVNTEGMFGSNVYIVNNEKNEVVVIDAGVDADQLAHIIESGKEVKYIILTHGHIDHICCLDQIREKTKSQAYIHGDDMKMIADPEKNGAMLFGRNFKINSQMNILKDGDILEFGENPIKIISTPGHSSGSICVKIGDFLFTGDTLFRESIGRTDLYTGDMDTIIKSIKEKILTLGDDTIVYPGHGPSSTVGYEKRNNGFLL